MPIEWQEDIYSLLGQKLPIKVFLSNPYVVSVCFIKTWRNDWSSQKGNTFLANQWEMKRA